jgi:hypothetical protein
LVIVLGILAVVTGIGTTAFIRMTDYWGGLKRHTELDRRAEAVFDSIKKDLASGIASPLTAESIVGTTTDAKNEAGQLFFNMLLADDTLSIPTLTPGASGSAAVPVVVTYVVRRDGSKDTTLVRSQRTLDSADGEEASVDIAPGVLQFRVEYTANGSDWVAEWPGPALPKALRISVNLATPEDPLREQIARKQVLPVHVQ